MISLICCLLRFYLPDVFGKGRFYWEMLLQTNGAMVGCCVCAWSLAGLWMVALGASVIVLMPDVSLCAGIVAMCGIAGGPLLAILNVLFVCGTYHNMAVHLWRHHDGRHPPLRSVRLCGHTAERGTGRPMELPACLSRGRVVSMGGWGYHLSVSASLSVCLWMRVCVCVVCKESVDQLRAY